MRFASTHSEAGSRWSHMDGRPAPQGMYDPRNEHDACGVGFVATLTGEADHALVDQALTVLRNLEHRGATGAEADSGDGAGILVQVPDAFLREVAGFTLPAAGRYVELLNTDGSDFGGSGHGNLGAVEAAPVRMHNRPFSLNLTIPPLGAVFFRR